MIDAIRDVRGSRPPWLRGGGALLFVLLASSLSVILHSWLLPAPLAPYFAAVALSAWYGGTGPAIAAIVLSLLPIRAGDIVKSLLAPSGARAAVGNYAL